MEIVIGIVTIVVVIVVIVAIATGGDISLLFNKGDDVDEVFDPNTCLDNLFEIAEEAKAAGDYAVYDEAVYEIDRIAAITFE